MKILRQFIRFGIVGISNTIIGYIIYALSLKAIRFCNMWPEYDMYIAQFLMFLLSVGWSYYWNSKYVFSLRVKSTNNVMVSLLKTYASYAFTSLFLSEILLFLWVKHLGINDYLAPILSLFITVPLNFLIQKFWAFKEKSGDE